MEPNFTARRKKLSKLMARKGVEAVFTSNHNDIFYYTGYSGLREDRIFMVFPADGKPKVIVTALENEAGEKYSNVAYIDDIKDFTDQLKPFRTLGYDEKYLNVLLFKEISKLNIRIEPAGKMLEIPRMVKDSCEISQIRKAIGITKKVFGSIGSLEGRKENEISDRIEIEFRKLGVKNSFDSIISSGTRSAFIHHKPGNSVIRKGEHVLIDMGCKYNGYCSDITRMFFRKLDNRRKEIYKNIKEIHDALIDSIKAGVTYKEIESVQSKLFRRKGYEVMHGFGHGVGLSVHEPVSDILNAGEVLTVEPGIYVKNVGGFRIEDMVLVKKGKAEMLSGTIPVI